MSYPTYHILDNIQKQQFKEALQKKINQSRFYPWLYRHITLSIRCLKLYFLLCFSIILFYSFSDYRFALISLLGFLSAQIMFAVFHTRIHALFLEYDEWNIRSENRVMKTPIVSFYAFYHHHHTQGNNWLPEASYFDSKDNPNGTNYIVLAHWYSFSFIYVSSKLPFVLFFLITAFYYAPFYSLAAYLGYEIGQFFIPVFHAYGHNVSDQILGAQKSNKKMVEKLVDNMNGVLFYIMKRLKLLATPKQHATHHLHYKKTPYVYRSFSSSGIYSPFIDKLLDRYYVWSFQKLPNKSYDVMRSSALSIVLFFFLLPFFIGLFF